jgi:hypothetical protein
LGALRRATTAWEEDMTNPDMTNPDMTNPDMTNPDLTTCTEVTTEAPLGRGESRGEARQASTTCCSTKDPSFVRGRRSQREQI